MYMQRQIYGTQTKECSRFPRNEITISVSFNHNILFTYYFIFKGRVGYTDDDLKR